MLLLTLLFNLQATDARRAFPCWDEPSIKATFDVTLVVPKDRVALSNMVCLFKLILIIYPILTKMYGLCKYRDSEFPSFC